MKLFSASIFLAAAFASNVAFAQADQQTPGTHIRIDPSALAKVNATPSANNSSETVRGGAGATLKVPAGFSVNVFSADVSNPRQMLIAPNGDVLLAQSGAGNVVVLRDKGDGTAQVAGTLAEGFRVPYGLSLYKDTLYIGDLAGAWRLPYKAGDTESKEKPQRITPSGAFGTTGGHVTRNVLVSPDGKKLYAAIGSSGNVGEDPAPRATVQVFDLGADGMATNQRTYASGTRNPVGIAFYPGTSDIYITVNERDTLGDELVPDYFTKIADGGFYGWPYSYIGKNPQPGYVDKRPDLVAKAIVPDLLFRSHSAPLGFAFSTGTKFPKEYQGGAFVALHGSWNAAQPRGYLLAYVPFNGGKPAGDYQVFATGFWSGGTSTASVMGRPAAVAVAKDGSLLVADDVGNRIWRISYGK